MEDSRLDQLLDEYCLARTHITQQADHVELPPLATFDGGMVFMLNLQDMNLDYYRSSWAHY